MTARISQTRLSQVLIRTVSDSDYFTSGVYPFGLETERLSTTLTAETSSTINIPIETIRLVGAVPESGNLISTGLTYNYPTEQLWANNIVVVSGNIANLWNVIAYNNYSDQLYANTITIESVVLRDTLILYDYGTEQMIFPNIQIISGSLT